MPMLTQYDTSVEFLLNTFISLLIHLCCLLVSFFFLVNINNYDKKLLDRFNDEEKRERYVV